MQEHIQEVLNKWQSIDDEIWAKIIVLERNRRVAKAYARAPVLTVNGSDDGFDGFRIGLAGFENPMRDQKTEEVKRTIGQGMNVSMVFFKVWVSGINWKKGWRQVEQGFSSSFSECLPYLMIFQSTTLKNRRVSRFQPWPGYYRWKLTKRQKNSPKTCPSM